MNNNYKYDVSFVIPVYNVENFLKECLDSILNQKYDINKIEIILINDGSKDNSLEICKNYKDKYNNIKLIDKKNEGVSVARNVGIENAEGKYILILDSDDFISNTAVKNLFNFFEEHYEDFDLLTYPIYFYTENKKTSIHPRYKEYDKGTGVYDINEYIYLNQSTVNIMFKNTKEIFYDSSMKLSEDQKFDTQLIMKKEKIGYCEDAVYYYRRHGGGVSQNINSMVYCFDSILDYNEWLIKKYTVKGKTNKYIQSLIINTINWRLQSNMLLPYHYENEEFDKAFNRIVNLIEHVDDDTILNMKNMWQSHKVFIFKLKKAKFNLLIDDNKLTMTANNNILIDTKKISLQLTNYYFDNNILHINGYLNTQIFEHFKPIVYIKITNKEGKEIKKKCELKYSLWSEKAAHFKTNTLFRIEEKIDTNDITKIKLYFKVKNKEFRIYLNTQKTASYITENNKKYAYINKKKTILIKNKNIFNNIKFTMKKRFKYLSSNPKTFIYRNIFMPILNKKNIWLYMDRKGIFDNGYYQFKHDFNKNDGAKRFFVYDDDFDKIKDKFTKEEQKYLIKYKSFKHRKLFLNCSILLTSFSDDTTYSPFGRNNFRYLDVKKYKFIYLQHGVLHANLKLMYGREFTDIYKFVVSSNFEKDNLMKNYFYSKNDFIESGMPRFDTEKVSTNNEAQNKIIFAPTWRHYLIGPIRNGKRSIFKEKFVNSNYYKKINLLLNNKELIKKLEEKNVILNFKLHPIFKDYMDLFKSDSKNVTIDYDNANLENYKMFITDFSSFQFDFIKHNRPILYFLPDKLEFKGGLHSYSELDLKYENAFGDLYLETEELVNRIIKEVDNGFVNSPKYSERMKNFFLPIKAHRENLYNELRKIK